MCSLIAAERSCRELDGWMLHEFASVPSTNPVAGALPAWHAVRSDVQTGGRGRTGRTWVSDAGGLWLSAVLPAPGPRKKWSILPLGAGWAVIQALNRIGAAGLRLRWPNDIMCDRRKLAGILVEQYQPETVVIGVGINLANQPATLDPALDGHTTSLADLLAYKPALDEITRLTLAALREVQQTVEQDRFSYIVSDINTRWGAARKVEISLNSQSAPLRGQFRGVDPEGRLSFADETGATHVFEASQVALLREVG